MTGGISYNVERTQAVIHFNPDGTVDYEGMKRVVDCMVDACVSPEGIVGTRQRRVVPRGPAWVRSSGRTG